jgi:hypothetical protein
MIRQVELVERVKAYDPGADEFAEPRLCLSMRATVPSPALPAIPISASLGSRTSDPAC